MSHATGAFAVIAVLLAAPAACPAQPPRDPKALPPVIVNKEAVPETLPVDVEPLPPETLPVGPRGPVDPRGARGPGGIRSRNPETARDDTLARARDADEKFARVAPKPLWKRALNMVLLGVITLGLLFAAAMAARRKGQSR
jgi:hypothetical protein